MPEKVHGAVIRERAAALRAIGADLSRRFRDRQIGSVRPGLTLEDGTLVVTDNYLKVRIPAGLSRNTRVSVGSARMVRLPTLSRPAVASGFSRTRRA